MIHHVSIPARAPRHVAEVLAEQMGGECHPFGPLEGAFMATSGDAHGTMIEVYKERAALDFPANDDQVVFGENSAPPNTWPFHVLLSVPLEPDEIERIGAREGWRAKTFGRGMQGQKPFFHVIEFWLEKRLMIEVVSPMMARVYEDFLKNAQLSVMSNPESPPLMRHAHKRAGLSVRPCQRFAVRRVGAASGLLLIVLERPWFAARSVSASGSEVARHWLSWRQKCVH